MTQLRIDKDALSNYFDRLLQGIGHRGSSFMDVDAVSHDQRTRRFLVQEFKRHGERLNVGQRRTLSAFAEIPAHFTVWIVIRRDDNAIGWIDWSTRRGKVISVEEYQARFKAWWDNAPAPSLVVRVVPIVPPLVTTAAHAPVVSELTADDISW